MQKFRVQKAPSDKISIESQIEEDPQIVIKQARQSVVQTEKYETTTSPIKVVETAKSQQQAHANTAAETVQKVQEDAYRKDAAKMVQFIEQEHYTAKSQSTLADLLAQPYCPPPMVYEKKLVVPPERAILTKAASVQSHNKSQTLKLVQEAIQMQAERFN